MISQHPTESEEFEAIVARSFEPTMELPVLPATSTWTDLTVVAQADHGPKPSLIHRPAAALEQARQRRQQSATAKGEARVAYQLGRLPQGWHVMHPVPVGQRADDRVHLVIGPGGVFTLDTKFHPSSKVWSNGEALWVNGRRTHELASSRYAATRASAVLGEAVGFAVRLGRTTRSSSGLVQRATSPGMPSRTPGEPNRPGPRPLSIAEKKEATGPPHPGAAPGPIPRCPVQDGAAGP